jgi:hypothetical protein
MRLLVDRAGQTTSPCFTVAELQAISPVGFDLLRIEKVLGKIGVAEEMDHPLFGRVAVRKTAGGLFLVDLSDPGRDWIKVEATEVERLRFSHQGMARWIARLCGTEREVSTEGQLWTVGTTSLSGRLFRILYYPGPALTEKLLAAIRTLDLDGAGYQHLLLLPFTNTVAAPEASRLGKQGLFLENLYQITTEESLDLELARLPDEGAGRKSGYFFRRVKGSNSWEVGFNTTTPVALPHGVAMDRIWLLLRNPGKEFTASEITNQLNATSDDRLFNRKAETTDQAYQRSKGTSARTIKDLTPEQQADGREIMQEVIRAKSDFGKGSSEHKEAEKEWKDFCSNNRLSDYFKGIVKLENDDVTKEAETLKRSIDRWIIQHKDSSLGDLVGHLDTTIIRCTSFSYSPPKEQPRLQWLT